MQETPLFERVAREMLRAGITSQSEGTQQIRKAQIVELLREHHGNMCRVARVLGIHRNTLGRQIREMNLLPIAKQLRAEHRPQRELNLKKPSEKPWSRRWQSRVA